MSREPLIVFEGDKLLILCRRDGPSPIIVFKNNAYHSKGCPGWPCQSGFICDFCLLRLDTTSKIKPLEVHCFSFE